MPKFLRFTIKLNDIKDEEKFYKTLGSLETILSNSHLHNYQVGFNDNNILLIRGEIRDKKISTCKAYYKILKNTLKDCYSTKITELVVATGEYV